MSEEHNKQTVLAYVDAFNRGDMDQLIESIRTKLFALSDKTAVYPGHGMRTTIGREKESNYFLQDL